jgi:hypothetical protein
MVWLVFDETIPLPPAYPGLRRGDITNVPPGCGWLTEIRLP